MVAPSGSCSSSALSACDAATMLAKSRSSPATWSSVAVRSASRAARAPGGSPATGPAPIPAVISPAYHQVGWFVTSLLPGGETVADSYADVSGLVERSAASYAASVPEHPADVGFFGPHSVTWRLSTDLSGVLGGGGSLIVPGLPTLA